MKRKYLPIWRTAIASASALTLIFSGLLIQSAEAVTSNPVPVCSGASCTVTFEYSGDNYRWTPPANAASISFDLQGAQGGVTGGKGGRVTGTFLTVPAELFIFVGGVGQRGSSAAGGFNGGGSAGLGFGDEGSGGGATDLRTATTLATRIVIAAGGGGSGGAIGGAGGSGGGLQGLAGKAARTEGGSGGTATGGGNGGLPYGGTSGTKGDLGIGGNGGSSSYSGGGGGGGGLYGGGGGGATLDTCCYGSGAGGGAGGSSFANASVISAPVHSVGVRSGSGVAIISYFLPPEVASFSAAVSTAKLDGITFNLNFNQDVTGLTAADFSQPENVCSNLVVAGSASIYTVTLSGCPDGAHRVALASNSVSGAGAGPPLLVNSTSVVLDSVSPSVVITSPTSPINSATPSYAIAISESVTGFESLDITVQGLGCSLDSLSGSGQSFTAALKGCQNGAAAQISVSASSIIDVAGNAGPAQKVDSALVAIDLAAPQATWAATSQTPSYTNPSFEVTFDEPAVGLQASDFSQIGIALGCSLSLNEITLGTRYSVVTSGCAFGAVQVALAAASFTDKATNPGASSQSGSILFAATPVAAPTPPVAQQVVPPVIEQVVQPVVAPVVETPTETPIETVVAPVVAPTLEPLVEPTIEPIAESVSVALVAEVVPTLLVRPAKSPSSSAPSEAKVAVEPFQAVEPIIDEPPVHVVPAQAIQSAGNGSKPLDLVGLAYLAIGILGSIAIAIGFVSSFKNLRLRRRVLAS